MRVGLLYDLTCMKRSPKGIDDVETNGDNFVIYLVIL